MNGSIQISIYRHASTLFWLLCGSVPQPVWAQIDKIYDPYVEAGKTETEFRSIYESDDNESRDGRVLARMGFGRVFTARLFLEAYL